MLVVAASAVGVSACRSNGTPAPTTPPNPTATPTGPLSQYQLVYRLLEAYPDYFWCDPDFFPIGRPGGEEANAADQFPDIRSNATEFTAILDRLQLPDRADFALAEQLAIYREHKKLTRIVEMTPRDGGFAFSLRTGDNDGFRITGAVTTDGRITVTTKEPSFNTCPICLARGTLIDTPAGAVPVERIGTGMQVWTVDAFGNRLTANVLAASATPVPPGFQLVKVTLSDGRSVSASPGHPTAGRRPLGAYQVGEALDRAVVASTEIVPYEGTSTYDILPAGPTGRYWANGILLASTLHGR
jgi:hypothetical protein